MIFMALNGWERAAAKLFRETARLRLAAPEAPGGREAADCPPVLSVYRHQCAVREGRTRPIRLDTVIWTSPEIWVTFNPRPGEGDWEAMWPREAERRLQKGLTAEYNVVPVTRFKFTWVHGQCRPPGCGQFVRSRDGILEELIRRPEPGGPGVEKVFLPVAAIAGDS